MQLRARGRQGRGAAAAALRVTVAWSPALRVTYVREYLSRFSVLLVLHPHAAQKTDPTPAVSNFERWSAGMVCHSDQEFDFTAISRPQSRSIDSEHLSVLTAMTMARLTGLTLCGALSLSYESRSRGDPSI
jgi:hypothetical protein